MKGFGKLAASIAFAAAITITATSPASADPGLLVGGAGAFDVNEDPVGAAALQYRFGDEAKLAFLRPHVGAMITGEAGTYVWAGLLFDLALTDNLMLTPTAAVGLWQDGNGKDLGNTIEFRTGLEAAWRFDDASRLGVGYYHISNAGLDDRNPGEEEVMVFYGLPIASLFGN